MKTIPADQTITCPRCDAQAPADHFRSPHPLDERDRRLCWRCWDEVHHQTGTEDAGAWVTMTAAECLAEGSDAITRLDHGDGRPGDQAKAARYDRYVALASPLAPVSGISVVGWAVR